jgi:hypothetical protein
VARERVIVMLLKYANPKFLGRNPDSTVQK